ncbi:Alpha/beta hydrolase family protein [Aspergillus parasiticus SU-1]|uniref:Alpha/beta hydrolase family protein n=1 Tax=Aspergillus parasiticus (strain ATCC 56775 / NRRL 5862 / SRRC 143 / SU-1) TaxID=1403190 RepID=A0A0F0I867_ASPPU|nr:Alpha/beta hydrolase family protein [Aspergillus parasiticus SU-1]
MAPERPNIVLVQGSFQTPLVYDDLLTRLRDLGYSVILPPLPSGSDVHHDDFPIRTLTDDALAVTKVVEQLVEDGKTVVLVMHSYGGIVGSEAIPESLSYRARQTRGQKGGVIHLFYYTAFLLDKGKSVLETFGESPNNDVRADGRFFIRNGASTLYSDLPDAEAKLWEYRLIAQSYRVQTTPVTRAAYEYNPSTYLVCDNDQAVPPQFQRTFARMAKAQVESCNTGHSPMLNQLGMLVQKIMIAVEWAATVVVPK